MSGDQLVKKVYFKKNRANSLTIENALWALRSAKSAEQATINTQISIII